MQRIFDGHNDSINHLQRVGDTSGEGFFEGGVLAHLDSPRARKGGFAGGFFALWSPAPNTPMDEFTDGDGTVMNEDPIDAVPTDFARETILQQAELAVRMAEEDSFRLCVTASDIEDAVQEEVIAALIHLEGAEGIGDDLSELDTLYEMGLRSLGPVWSRPNNFGHGVPFHFDKSPDTGPGLSDAGRRLIQRCAEKNIIVDLAHMNEAGFWDIAKAYDGPLLSTHSGVHALCPATRNLTNKQLSAIAERTGIVGLNYHCAFLRSDGRQTSETELEVLIRHLDALLNALGEDGVALGSDFDGALMPRDLADAGKLQNLVAAMDQAGFGAELIEKICWSNWIAMIRRIIG